VGARFSAPVQTGPRTHPASCTMGSGPFPGVESGWGVTLTPYPLQVPRSKKQSRAIPLLSQRAFMACKKGETNQPLIPTLLTFTCDEICFSGKYPIFCYSAKFWLCCMGVCTRISSPNGVKHVLRTVSYGTFCKELLDK
jgi:hypothetical protein